MMLPVDANEIPTATAMTRIQPKKIESPIPLNGPIKAALTESTAAPSNSPFATRSSIDTAIPPTKGASCGVILKNATCLVKASA